MTRALQDDGAGQAAELESQRALRDLMSLLTLPALWVGREVETVFQLMTEAMEGLVPVSMSYVDVQPAKGVSRVERLRINGFPASTLERVHWNDVLHALHELPISSAPSLVATPLGEMRVVRLSLGFSAQGGSVWFGSMQPDFPRASEAVLLRAGVTLASTGMQAARLASERQRASRAKDEFLAMLGHELRNPLAPIFTSLEVIKQTQGLPLDMPHAVIERQARHLSRLVDDLLDVSRVTMGKVDLSKCDLRVAQLLGNALEAVDPLFKERKHSVNVQLPDEEVVVHGDPVRMTQVFVNLLNNAAKYTSAGGRIGVKAVAENHEVHVYIEDNGAGISPKLMPRLFTLFEQGDRTIDRADGGLGIGLALVQTFVLLHGGTVSVHSDGPGRGTTFKVTLPRKSAGLRGEELARKPETAKVSVLKGLRVLLVDDNEDALESLSILLRMHGAEVCGVTMPSQALEALDNFSPTAAILDVGLPQMNGYELAHQVRQRSPGAKLITLSGYGSPEDHARAKQAGLDAHLVKPVDLAKLLEHLGGCV